MDTDSHGSRPRPYLTLNELDGIGRVRHVFTTRQGGVGGRSGGFKAPDDWNVVTALFGVTPDRLVTLHQVHGDDIIAVDENGYGAARGRQADGLVTAAGGIVLGVETADCVPVLLVDPVTPAIAAVHAGWRSTVKGIVRKTVLRMQHEYGSDPSRMVAGIGPAIGPECYEVDEPVMGPVRAAFRFWKEITTARGNGRWSLDLVRANSIELAESGLKDRNIHAIGLCTSCRRDLFYSYRAEGRTGRMLAAIMIR